MKRRCGIATAVVCLALTGEVEAQTHPCDQPALTTQTVTTGAQHRVQFCAKPADAPEAFTIYTNGTASDLRALTLVVAPNALGYALYQGPQDLQFAAGAVVIEVTLWNREYAGGPSQESARSAPLSLTGVVGTPVPAAPVGLRVVR
jgi:hypothetical protein